MRAGRVTEAVEAWRRRDDDEREDLLTWMQARIDRWEPGDSDMHIVDAWLDALALLRAAGASEEPKEPDCPKCSDYDGLYRICTWAPCKCDCHGNAEPAPKLDCKHERWHDTNHAGRICDDCCEELSCPR